MTPSDLTAMFWWMVGIGVVGMVGGILAAVFAEKQEYFYGVFFAGFLVIFGGVGAISPLKLPVDLSQKQIEYKSIDPAHSDYFAIGKDGTIYTITKEQWAGLEVPIIAETK